MAKQIRIIFNDSTPHTILDSLVELITWFLELTDTTAVQFVEDAEAEDA